MQRRTFLQSAAAGAAVTGLGVSGFCYKGGMIYRTLGRTGIKLSLLGYGSHLTQQLREKPDERDRHIQLSIDRGVNNFDIYDHGYKQFKPMAKSFSGKRDKAVISLVSVEKDSRAEVEGALKTFNTDYIDLYRAVNTNPEHADPLFELKEQGKIRAVGIVAHYEEILLKQLDEYDFDYIMIPYNFHHNSAGTSGTGTSYEKLMWIVKERNLGLIAMKPIGSPSMIELAQKHNLMEKTGDNPSIPKAMLHYIYENPNIASVIPAMNSIDELEENYTSLEKPMLDDEERQALSKLSRLAFESKSAYLPNHYKWLERWAPGNQGA